MTKLEASTGTYVGTKAFFERFIGKFWSVSILLDPDPDSGKPIECGSMRIRIHNT